MCVVLLCAADAVLYTEINSILSAATIHKCTTDRVCSVIFASGCYANESLLLFDGINNLYG